MGDREKNVGFAAALNILFTVIELIGGLLTNSLALIADSLHDFADSFALIIAWYAEKKAKKPATSKMGCGKDTFLVKQLQKTHYKTGKEN